MVYSYKDIWKVSLPIMLGLLAQNIVQLTDTFFLGHVSDPGQPGIALEKVYFKSLTLRKEAFTKKAYTLLNT